MTAHNNLDVRTIFSTVRHGVIKAISEIGDFYATGLRANQALTPPDTLNVSDGVYSGGIIDSGLGVINHNPDAIIRDTSVPVSLTTFADPADFVDNAVESTDITFPASGAYDVSFVSTGTVEVVLSALNIVNFGFVTFNPGLSIDGLTEVQAWHTNGASLGANVRLQFSVAEVINRVSVFMSGAGNTCTFDVQASINKVNWVTLGSGYSPVLAGWNNFDFVNAVDYKYYRVVLSGRTASTETTFITEFKAYTTDSNFLVSGFTDYDTSKFADADFVDLAFSTDGVPAGSRIGFRLAAANKVNRIGLFMVGAGCTSTFKVLASDDYVTFNELGAGFVCNGAGWNFFNFINQTNYLYYAIELETDATVETDFCTQISASYTGKYFDNYGFSFFDPVALIDGVLIDPAINVSNSPAGSYIQINFDAPVVFTQLALNMSDAGFVASFDWQVSQDGVVWTSIVNPMNPALIGNNVFNVNIAGYLYQYYRLVLIDDNSTVIEPVTIQEMTLSFTHFSKEMAAISTGFAGETTVMFNKRDDTDLNYIAEHTLGIAVDLTGVDYVYFWARANVVEANAALVTILQGVLEYSVAVDITVENQWIQHRIDLTAVADVNKNAINMVRVTIGNTSANKSLILDGLIGAFFTCSEFALMDFVPEGDYEVKVLAYTNISAGPPFDTGSVWIQVGDGVNYEQVVEATVEQVLLAPRMPQTEYDFINSLGAQSVYLMANIVLFSGTYERTYDPGATVFLRVYHNGAHRAIAGLLYEVA